MTSIQALFSTMQNLPLEALEQVYDFLNKQPYKHENRQPTAHEVQAMKGELAQIITKLREQYGEGERNEALERLLKVKSGRPN